MLPHHHHWILAVARTSAVAVDTRLGAGIRNPVAGDNSLPGQEEVPGAVDRLGEGIEWGRLRRNPYSTWSDNGETELLVAVGKYAFEEKDGRIGRMGRDFELAVRGGRIVVLGTMLKGRREGGKTWLVAVLPPHLHFRVRLCPMT